jgi:putative ABC transport system permease protein
VLGGASPAEAARVQLTVLLGLLAVEIVAALTVSRLVVAGVTAPGERITRPGSSRSAGSRPRWRPQP